MPLHNCGKRMPVALSFTGVPEEISIRSPLVGSRAARRVFSENGDADARTKAAPADRVAIDKANEEEDPLENVLDLPNPRTRVRRCSRSRTRDPKRPLEDIISKGCTFDTR
jgi:hypothetical protein